MINASSVQGVKPQYSTCYSMGLLKYTQNRDGMKWFESVLCIQDFQKWSPWNLGGKCVVEIIHRLNAKRVSQFNFCYSTATNHHHDCSIFCILVLYFVQKLNNAKPNIAYFSLKIKETSYYMGHFGTYKTRMGSLFIYLVIKSQRGRQLGLVDIHCTRLETWWPSG